MSGERSGPFFRGAVFLSVVMSILSFSFVAAAAGPVIVIGIRGEIDAGQTALVFKALNEAETKKADTLLVEIETFGGQVDAAVKIRDMISDSKLRTICYVKNRAWSAGALVAIAHKNIAMAPGGTIGAAEPIPTTEKTVAAVRAEFAATASKMGRNPKVAEAMVDKSLGFGKYAVPGKILSLTDAQAIEVGYADVVAADRSAVLKHYGLQDSQVIEVQSGWAERIAGWLSDPVVKSALVGIIFLAVMTEVKTAGTGVAALFGIVATGLFFGSQWITGVATWVEVLLFLVGLVLLAVEFFVPGFGIFGIAGIASILFSLFMTLGGGIGALNIMAGGVVLAVIVFLLLLKYLPSSKLWNRLVLKDDLKTDKGYISSDNLSALIGQEGVVLTLLRPAGTVRITDQVYDVVSEGRFIEPGVTIKVLSVNGNRILVRAVEP
jgi:membrane-bound serine protease (ClpP class)